MNKTSREPLKFNRGEHSLGDVVSTSRKAHTIVAGFHPAPAVQPQQASPKGGMTRVVSHLIKPKEGE